MQLDPVLKERVVAIGKIMASIEIDESFWDDKNPFWQNTNNHTMLMLRHYYYDNEYDDEFKATFGQMLDKMIWLYVTQPEWRARLGWISWFIQLYILDKQTNKEHLENVYLPELWNDPQKWKDIKPSDARITTVLKPKEDTTEVNLSDSISRSSIEGSH